MILVPGLLCTERLWHDQIEDLADIADCRPTMAQTRFDSLPLIAKTILAEAPPRFALAGLSMGGYVALEIMRQAADRVTRLALLDSSARADTAEQTERRNGLIKLAGMGQFKGVTPRLMPLLVHPARMEDKALVDAIVGMAEKVGKEGFLRQQRAVIARPDSRVGLRRINCPTLVLVGRQDAITPLSHSEEMAEAIPGAKLVVIDDCGHMATMEKPAEVNRAMRDWFMS